MQTNTIRIQNRSGKWYVWGYDENGKYEEFSDSLKVVLAYAVDWAYQTDAEIEFLQNMPMPSLIGLMCLGNQVRKLILRTLFAPEDIFSENELRRWADANYKTKP